MQIKQNISLKNLNTFGIDVMAKQLVEIEQPEELFEFLTNRSPDEKMLVLGGGSNILFTENFDGTIIRMNTKGIEIVGEDEVSITLKVAAGEAWEDLINYTIRHNYYGIENLSGIPGSVGASPVQNIGAYGVEVKDVIEKVEGVFLEDGRPFVFHHQECEFGYRSSVFKTEFKNRTIITFVYFKFSKRQFHTLHYAGLEQELSAQGLPLTLQNISDTIIAMRNRKLPDVNKIGSAGSFFKNPIISKVKLEELLREYPQLVNYFFSEKEVKLAAGQLIELCGWKGYRQGDAGVYPHQALVIVNYGNATGKEIKELCLAIQKSVKERFGIEIVPEVNFIPFL